MHELSIAMALYEACKKEPHRPEEFLVEVRVLIGEFAGVQPDLLEFAWKACIRETPDEGATLEIQYEVARQVCDQCGPVGERQPGSWLRLCPHCGCPLRIEGGHELDIIALCFEASEVLARTIPDLDASTCANGEAVRACARIDLRNHPGKRNRHEPS